MFDSTLQLAPFRPPDFQTFRHPYTGHPLLCEEAGLQDRTYTGGSRGYQKKIGNVDRAFVLPICSKKVHSGSICLKPAENISSLDMISRIFLSKFKQLPFPVIA